MDQSYLTLRDLMSSFKVSRPTIYRWIKDYGFPKPVKLGPNASRWLKEETEQWAQSRPRKNEIRP